MSVGGKVTSSPAPTHCLWTSSTSSTHTDIHTPRSAVSSPSGPNVEVFAPLPRLPWPPWQRKISHSPDPTAPNVGGVPQSQHFFQPHFSNHAKLAGTSDTFKIGVMCFASMGRKHTTHRLRRGGPFLASDPSLSFAYAERNPPTFLPFPSVLALLCQRSTKPFIFIFFRTLQKKCSQNLPTIHISALFQKPANRHLRLPTVPGKKHQFSPCYTPARLRETISQLSPRASRRRPIS
jgi:hypothetical protein